MKTKKTSWLAIIDLLLEFSYLAVIFCLPLCFAIFLPTYNIFELNKLIFFKIAILFLFGLSLLKILFYPSSYLNLSFFRERGRKYFWRNYLMAPLIFIVLLSFASLASSNLSLSFFGSYFRQEGLLSYFFYFLWLLLLIFNLLTVNNSWQKKNEDNHLTCSERLRRNLARVFIAMVASASVVSLYGVLQILGIDYFTWPEPPLLTGRAFSSFGQPNFLASWLLFTIPITVYFFILKKGLLPKFLLFLTVFIQLLALFFTASRAAWLALFIVTALFFLTYLWRQANWPRFKKIGLLLVALVFALVIIAFVDKTSAGRISRSFNLADGSVAARLEFWQASLPAIAQKPIFGYGLENYSDVFLSAYQPNWAIFGKVNASPDRAHNLILDILLSGGLVALLAWFVLLFFVMLIYLDNNRFAAWRLLNKSLFFGLSAYLISLLFGFSFVSGHVYFFLFIAILVVINICVRCEGERKILWPFLNSIAGVFKRFSFRVRIAEQEKVKRKELKIVFALFVAIFLIWQIIVQVKNLMADHYFNALYYQLGSRNYFTAYTLYDYTMGAESNPSNLNYYQRFLAGHISNFWPEINELSVQQAGLVRLSDILVSLPENGYDNFLVKAKILALLEEPELAQQYLDKAKEIGPRLPNTYLESARIYRYQSDFEQARDHYLLALDYLPDLGDPLLNDMHKQSALFYKYSLQKDLGDLYLKAKDYVLAEKYYWQAYYSQPLDFTIFKKIADTYYLRGDFAGALKYNLRGFRYSPKDYHWPLAIAFSYQGLGDEVKFIEYLKLALALAPAEAGLDKLLEDNNFFSN